MTSPACARCSSTKNPLVRTNPTGEIGKFACHPNCETTHISDGAALLSVMEHLENDVETEPDPAEWSVCEAILSSFDFSKEDISTLKKFLSRESDSGAEIMAFIKRMNKAYVRGDAKREGVVSCINSLVENAKSEGTE